MADPIPGVPPDLGDAIVKVQEWFQSVRTLDETYQAAQAELSALRSERDRLRQEKETVQREAIERIRLHMEEVVLARRERDQRHAKQLAAEADLSALKAQITALVRRYGIGVPCDELRAILGSLSLGAYDMSEWTTSFTMGNTAGILVVAQCPKCGLVYESSPDRTPAAMQAAADRIVAHLEGHGVLIVGLTPSPSEPKG